MESRNEWQMGSDYYNIVALQIKRCLEAQSIAKEDTKQYDEWFDEITKLDTLTGNLFSKKYQETRKQKRSYIMDLMSVTKSYNFNLNLDSNKKKRFLIHEALIDWQNWLIATAHANNLLIRKSDYDYSDLQSRL